MTESNDKRSPGIVTGGNHFYVEVFLVSFAGILLEVAHTRVFSFKLYYYFTYLIIGIALLGIGSGSVLVSIFTGLQRLKPRKLIALASLLGALSVFVGWGVVTYVQLNAWRLPNPVETAKLALVCLTLFLPFLTIGVIIAAIFAERVAHINRVYFADLAGGALGCVVAVPAMIYLSPPGAIFVAAAALALTALLAASGGSGKLQTASAGLAALSLFFVILAPRLADPVPDELKSMSPQRRGETPPLFSRWHPVFRVDVADWFADHGRYVLMHDGMMGSVMLHFDGDFAKLGAFNRDPRALPFRVFAGTPRVLIIGAAGGHEILASLYFGASHVTGVELNPLTVSLLKGHFADYTGRIAFDKRVSLINGEGRAYLASTHEDYDLVWFVAPDSYAAMNAATSGAFVLAESYLYTREMLEMTLRRLRPNGIICAQFGEFDFERKPNRTARYLATAREAFGRVGIDDFSAHVLVATSADIPGLSTIILRREPFSEQEAEQFANAVSKLREGRIRYSLGNSQNHRLIEDVVKLPVDQLPYLYALYPFQITPVTDDRPFFWHFSRFRDVALPGTASTPPVQGDPEVAVGERALLTLLVFVATFAGFALFLPFFSIPTVWLELPFKGRTAVYFAALGVGFMAYEITLIQKFTLLLGYPTYSLTITLATLLISTGLGSFLSAYLKIPSVRILVLTLSALLLVTILLQTALFPLIGTFIGSWFITRMSLAVLVLFPLGLLLGVFMPLGLRCVNALSRHGKEYVAWAWAVNGFFSVVGSVLTTVLAMAWGFYLVLAFAAVVYVCGVCSLLSVIKSSRLSPNLTNA